MQELTESIDQSNHLLDCEIPELTRNGLLRADRPQPATACTSLGRAGGIRGRSYQAHINERTRHEESSEGEKPEAAVTESEAGGGAKPGLPLPMGQLAQPFPAYLAQLPLGVTLPRSTQEA